MNNTSDSVGLKSAAFGELLVKVLLTVCKTQDAGAKELGWSGPELTNIKKGKTGIDRADIMRVFKLLENSGKKSLAFQIVRSFELEQSRQKTQAARDVRIPADSDVFDLVSALRQTPADSTPDLNVKVLPVAMLLREMLLSQRADDAFFDVEALWGYLHDTPKLSPFIGNHLRGTLQQSAKSLTARGRARRLLRAMDTLGRPERTPDPISWAAALEAAVPATQKWEKWYDEPKLLPASYSASEWKSLAEAPDWRVSDRTFFHCPALDAHLSKDPKEGFRAFEGHRQGERLSILMKTDESQFKLSELAATVAPYALSRAFGRGTMLYNAPKSRLASDFTLEALTENDHHVHVQRTDYYTEMATNAASSLVVKERDREIYDGLELFFDKSGKPGHHPGRYRQLSNSECANLIGVNVLAVTRDGHLLIQHQTAGNHREGESFVPTASGNVDWVDAEVAKSFDELIYRASLRELVEETGLDDASCVTSFQVIGYTLLASYGLKPDFYALATLDLTIEDVKALRHRDREALVHDQMPFSLALSKPSEALRNLEGLQDVKMSFNAYLNANLFFLKRHLSAVIDGLE